jgi:hypothetical protein
LAQLGYEICLRLDAARDVISYRFERVDAEVLCRLEVVTDRADHEARLGRDFTEGHPGKTVCGHDPLDGLDDVTTARSRID